MGKDHTPVKAETPVEDHTPVEDKTPVENDSPVENHLPVIEDNDKEEDDTSAITGSDPLNILKQVKDQVEENVGAKQKAHQQKVAERLVRKAAALERRFAME